jgi:hypothetical protein
MPYPPEELIPSYIVCEFLLNFIYGVYIHFKVWCRPPAVNRLPGVKILCATYVPLLCHVPIKTRPMSPIGKTADP